MKKPNKEWRLSNVTEKELLLSVNDTLIEIKEFAWWILGALIGIALILIFN